MSHEQAQEFLLVLYEQMMIREKTFQELLKQEWRLDLGTISG
ncbi:Phycobilisome degradation protein NblA [Nostoc flagelliforme CCNUN1]|uniref:Phycobilisome degradation protein NblA n=2 Tax=Nostoc flagelliforme TaxID=1306274 RepID=A0A2K8SMJ2_9NOSO|nr:Phycobilisome degradation protein NblA [Nostoc flagelliforme CCNUN1]